VTGEEVEEEEEEEEEEEDEEEGEEEVQEEEGGEEMLALRRYRIGRVITPTVTGIILCGIWMPRHYWSHDE
jgi:CO dehydrogenase/acetyl-CoA synthase beta subunit